MPALPYMIVPPEGAEQSDEWVKLGIEAQTTGKLPEAQRFMQMALKLDPQDPIATQNLAIVFAQSNMLNEALLTIERASLLSPQHGVIHMNWALMALEADRIDEALMAGRKGVEVAPNCNTRLALAMVLATAGLPSEALPLYDAILEEDPKHPQAGHNSCFVQTLSTNTPKELRIQRDRWNKNHRYNGEKKPHDIDRTPGRKLRIGYVGGDFKCHSASMIFGAVVGKHDKEKFETFLYSTLAVDPVADVRTKYFQENATFRDVQSLDDEKLDALIRGDKIDILVELAGHTNGGRLSVFTRKPAPIQVTAWGFAHGTGIPEIDYFFADPVSVPGEEREHYVEKIYDLPCIISYDPPTEYKTRQGGKSSLPYHRNGFITFGTFARYEKLSDECLATFNEILMRVPDSKIVFKDHGFRRPYSIRRIRKALEHIDPDRMLFMLATSHFDHVQSYQQVDICLDPFPHGGGVVSVEQLYMGVPLVTRYGTQPAGRSASSVLTQMGRPNWIAHSKDEYATIATELARDIPTLDAVRKTLRQELLDSPVVKGYREKVEAAYQEMWANLK